MTVEAAGPEPDDIRWGRVTAPIAGTAGDGHVALTVAGEVATAWRDWAAAQEADLTSALLAALALVVHRFTGAERVTVAVHAPERATASLEVSGALAWPALVRHARAARRAGGDGPATVALGLDAGPEAHGETSPLALWWRVSPDGGLEGEVAYDRAWFDDAFARHVAAHVEQVLVDGAEHAFARPAPPLTPADLALLRDFNDTRRAYPRGERIDDVIGTYARETPDAVAVQDAAERLTYGELWRRAGAVASGLQARGLGGGDVVGVALPRSVDLVVALLGILRSGGAYVALDAAWPPSRVAGALADARARLVVVAGGQAGGEHLGTTATLRELEAVGAATGATPAEGRSGSDVCCVFFTSGSSGRPKGILSPHRATVRVLADPEWGPLDAQTVLLQAAPLPWDGLSLELWGGLLNGGRCVLHDGPLLRAAQLRAAIARGVTTVWLTASVLHALVDEDVTCLAGLRLVMAGGEALSRSHVARVLREHPGIQFVNGYGPAESAIFATVHRVGHEDCALPAGIPIGRPIANTEVYVVREILAGNVAVPAPAGAEGEILVAGDGLAVGYAGLPEDTATRFVDIELPGIGRRRCYRTGDLGSIRPDGRLCFTGRADRQVKLRGTRIELPEVEAALAAHPDLARALVVARRNGAGDTVESLAGYYTVRRGGSRPTPDDLREHLLERLPAAMVPATFTRLDDIPLSPNGKIDATRLPEPSPGDRARGRSAATTSTTRNEWLPLAQRAMAEVLGVADVGPADNFMALGGDSLGAARVIATLSAASGAELSQQAFMLEPTAATLAAMLGQAGRTPLPPPGPVATGQDVALSPTQWRFWLMEQMAPGSPRHVVQAAFLVEGEVDHAALRQAARDVLDRHEALRTVFPLGATAPVQQVLAPADVLTVRHQPGATSAVLRASAAALASAEHRGFDVEEELPLRLLLVQGDDAALLLLTQHHIATDAWSEALMLEDLGRCYGLRLHGVAPGDPSGLSPRDHAAWLGEALEISRPGLTAYWTRALQSVGTLEWPAAVRAADGAESRVADIRFEFDAEVEEAWRRLAAERGTTLFSCLMAMYALALERVTGSRDFVVAVPVAGRTHLEFDATVGAFVNTLPVRLRLDGVTSGAEATQLVQQAMAEALEHQMLPYEDIVQAAASSRSGRDFVRTLFSVNPERGAPAFTGTRVERLPLPSTEDPFDLSVELWPRRGGLELVVGYDTAALDPRFVAELAQDLADALRSVSPASAR